MGAFRNLSGAEISFRWKVDTPLASCGNIEAKTPGIGFHSKKVKSLAPRTKIIRLLRCIKLRVERMKEPIEKVPLVLLGDSTAEIHNLELDPLVLSV